MSENVLVSENKAVPLPLGVHDGVTNEAYHGDTSAISKSGLDLIERSPLHFWDAKLNPDRPKEDKAAHFVTGSALHMLVLEPELFPLHYVAEPNDAPKRPTTAQRNAKKPSPETVEAIAWWDAFEKANTGKQVLDGEELAQLHAMKAAIIRNADARGFLGKGMAEVTVVWKSDVDGIHLKCRPDWIFHGPDGDVLVDLKTTEDASHEGFRASAARYRYHVQAAMYLDGYECATGRRPLGFVFIAVEKKRPYGVGVYPVSTSQVVIGQHEYKRNVQTYSECLRNNVWPDYNNGLATELGLPGWYRAAA